MVSENDHCDDLTDFSSLENGYMYIGLRQFPNCRQWYTESNEQQSTVISSYIKPLADFIIPKSQIKLIEILGKGIHDIINLLLDVHVHV